MTVLKAFLFSLLFSMLVPDTGYTAEQSFADWLVETRAAATKAGIRTDIINQALPLTMKSIPRIVELDRKQPEGKLTFAQYKERIVNQTRVKKGRQMMRKHQDILARVSQKYNVQPQYIVALWGIETNFGSNTGGFDVINALATLAHDGRRAKFFTDELMNALQILNEGHITHANMKGSWAGAMGQSQFMPSSFLAYAEDFNGDGRRDIWTTQEDVFASAANYLARSGWKGDQTWGRQVTLPSGFSKSLIGKKIKKPLAFWQNAGVRRVNGHDLPQSDDVRGYIVQPDGASGASYLAYNNYETILRWNRSTYFATSVGLLANAIAAY